MCTAVDASDNHVRFPLRSNAKTTVNARKNKAFAVLTDQASVLLWHPHSSPHCYSPRYFNVSLRQFGVFVNCFPSEAEKIVNTLKGCLFQSSHFWRNI